LNGICSKGVFLQARYNYKVPNGKLLKVSVGFEGSIVTDIKVTGDFFLYPETGIDLIEKSIKGRKLEELQPVLDRVVKENNLRLFGFAVKDLVYAIGMAKEGEEK